MCAPVPLDRLASLWVRLKVLGAEDDGSLALVVPLPDTVLAPRTARALLPRTHALGVDQDALVTPRHREGADVVVHRRRVPVGQGPRLQWRGKVREREVGQKVPREGRVK